jgi:RNA polymerase sigma-70 factor (ECF subfamily)
MVDRSPAAARQLASRARRRVRGEARVPDADLAEQQEVVDAFFAAARDADFDCLVAVLDPDVVLRIDGVPGVGRGSRVRRGAHAVARASLAGARRGRTPRPALVNGAPGFVLFEHGVPVSVLSFTVARGKIAEVDMLGDPERLRRLDLTSFRA